MNKHSWPTLAVLALAVAALAGCSSSTPAATAPGTTAAPGTSSAAPSTPAGSSAAAVLKAATSTLGKIVVDAVGKTVYYFDKDTAGSGKSACSGGCAAVWPAVVATSATPAVDGVTGTVGTITRDDGTKQVTINGLPVYTYTPDAKPGDVTGQGFGGIWWVISPDGDKVTGNGATNTGY
ncbi:COG4315 family predicted lipoprotein [Pseudarthrobacter sp. P1]|uniref:COG4315 family predicted lipoprotein n=1 Tax=Pseudarthrobacter sp. P1 TaxID=3418418 RepID=UPI003CE8454F